MERLQVNIPDMYADHHVLKVRMVLAALEPKVQNVVASSAFRIVAFEYDPAEISEETILGTLTKAGYPVTTGPVAVNPVVPVVTGRADPAWDRLGVRISHTDARDAKQAR